MTIVNNPAPTPVLNHPRGFVMLNNINVPWEHFSISNTRYSASGTFKIMLPANSLPKTASLPTLVNVSPIVVQVNGGNVSQTNPNNATPSDVPMLIMGEADELIYNPLTTMVTISGRDYSAKFLDNKLNQVGNPIGPELQTILSSSTSSTVVSMVAENRGLTAIVTPTSNEIGIYLQQGFSLLNSQITEWDLMVFLAREEGYDLFVIGKSLYFQPRNETSAFQATLTTPYYSSQTGIQYSNFESIELTRNMKLAKNIIVQVTSWNVQDKTTYTAIATLIHSGTGQESATEQPAIYNYRFPNLTQPQCQKKAQTLLTEISQHELTFTGKGAGNNLITAQSSILVRDTGTVFDQTYYVKNVTKDMSFGSGFNINVEAKTTPPVATSLQ